MKVIKRRKAMALIVVLCIVLQLTAVSGTRVSAEAPQGLSVISYYVGGTGAHDTNNGESSRSPFATLARAAQAVNSNGAGTYRIILLGNTTESQEVILGDGTNTINVNLICRAPETISSVSGSAIADQVSSVSGSAIIARNSSYKGDLISVRQQTTLTLGESNGSSFLTIDGLGDQVAGVKNLIFVYREGRLNVNENVILCNNDSSHVGAAAILVQGMVVMEGGCITNIRNGGSGAIINQGTFHLKAGTICNNTAYSIGGGIHNYGTLIMEGGSISGNTVSDRGGGVYNYGILRLNGGEITGNHAPNGAGIYNNGTLEINGGVIRNNHAENGGGIYNTRNLEMTGGMMIGNTASSQGGGITAKGGTTNLTGGLLESNKADGRGGAIDLIRGLLISGEIRIPAGENNNENDIYISGRFASETITLAGPLNHTERFMIGGEYYDGKQVLSGDTELIAQYYDLFGTANANYRVTGMGTLEYIGETTTYYVGGTGADDSYGGTDIGSREHPFASLSGALAKNGDNSCILVLQSDITVSNSLCTRGGVTVISGESQKHTITVDFEGNEFIMNYGSLSFGNANNQDEEDTLVIHGGQRSIRDAIINWGQLSLYSGVRLTGFRSNALVDNSGVIEIYGGVISDNNLALGIFNCSTMDCKGFRMYGGKISNNFSRNFILNDMGDNQLLGGIICENKAYYYVLNIQGTLLMSGGSIINNEVRAAVGNYGNFIMTGGNISNNTEYGVYNAGTVKMSGGTICNNASGGFNNLQGAENKIYLSGKIEISAAAPAPSIFLSSVKQSVVLESALRNTEVITVASDNYHTEQPLISGSPELIREYHDQFACTDSDYAIDEKGYINFRGEVKQYYVDEASQAELSNGAIDTPFRTIQEAVEKIGGGAGTIILQSDITLKTPIIIQGNIWLTDDGNGPYTIWRDEWFIGNSSGGGKRSHMIKVTGILDLGNRNNGGSDEEPSLILDGGSERGYDNDYHAILYNRGIVRMYSGVSLQHNNARRDVGAILNDGTIQMYGGLIRSNTGSIGGIELIPGSTFIMEGGMIKDNEGDMTGGIYNGGSFIMNGGCISGNSGVVGGILSIDQYNGEQKQVLTALNGGTIKENAGTAVYTGDSSLYPGVAVIEPTKLQMSGDIQVTEGDQIALFTGDGNQRVEITGGLTGGKPIATLALYEAFSWEGPIRVNPYGRLLLASGGNYKFSYEDADKLSLRVSDETADYAINEEGKVGTRLREDWVQITNQNGKIYNGYEHTVSITVTDGTTVLEGGIDYNVTYRNNVLPGTASVIINGIGTYAGFITKTFYIASPPVQEPTATPGPAAVPEESITTAIGSDGVMQITMDFTSGTAMASGEDIRLPVSTDLMEQISSEHVESINISILASASLFNHNPAQQPGLLLDAGILAAAREHGKQIAVTVKDENGKERYTWSFDGERMAASGKELKDVNLAIRVSDITEDSSMNSMLGDRTGLLLNFDHEGELPAAARVRIYVGDRERMEPGTKIYLYHYNEITKNLETLPYSSNYIVDEEGYLTVRLVHCSVYLALTEKAESSRITSLRDQIKVSSVTTLLYAGGTRGKSTVLKVKLPPTLERVESLRDNTSAEAIGGVTVIFSSSDKKVATVSKTGEITAKGVGKAVITTKIKLYSGKTKTIKTMITVTEPYLRLTASLPEMKVGEEFVYTAKGHGVATEDILWSGSNSSVIFIDQKTGRAVAKAKGTAYITASVGNVKKKIKITVK